MVVIVCDIAPFISCFICSEYSFCNSLQIIPLHKRNERTAAALIARLRQEAEELRKEKKRNTVSGIHK